MERLNLTLDHDTHSALTRYAREHRQSRAGLARELIREALGRREALERQRKLARDYAAGRADAAELLVDLERLELEILECDA